MQNRKGQLGSIGVRMTQADRKMARILYWDDVPGQHARKRRSTEWRDVTEWSDQDIQLWRMQVIAEAGVQDPKKPIPSEVNFKSHAKEWLEQNLMRYKPSFRPTVKMFVNRYLLPAFKTLAIEEITDPVVDKWVGTVRLMPKEGQQIGDAPSQSTLRHLVIYLGRIIGRSIENIHYPSDLKPPQVIYCPTDAEVQKLIAGAEGVYRVLFALAAGSGMRAGELYGLHIEGVLFKQNAIRVRQSFSRGALTTPKSRGRIITVDPSIMRMVREYAGNRTSGFLLLSTVGTALLHDNMRHRH